MWHPDPSVEVPFPMNDHVLSAVLVHHAPVEGIFQINLTEDCDFSRFTPVLSPAGPLSLRYDGPETKKDADNNHHDDA